MADIDPNGLAPVSAEALATARALASGAMRDVTGVMIAGRSVVIMRDSHMLWAVIRRRGRAGVALRIAHSPAPITACRLTGRRNDDAGGFALTIRCDSLAGRSEIILTGTATPLLLLRATQRFTPAAPLLYVPPSRDLLLLGGDGRLAPGNGPAEASQRKLNSGLVYQRFPDRRDGALLYFQNLTALNGYFTATGTVPESIVGGSWPEFGTLLPPPPVEDAAADKALPVGDSVTLTDALLVLRDEAAEDDAENALHFLQMLGLVHDALPPPDCERHDWVARAEATIRDLARSPKATIRHYGCTYIHPYTASEYPDSMVQLSVLQAVREYAAWRGRPLRLDATLAKGIGRFFDPKLGAIRRYLPNVGDDKNANAVDSWYLYHPLLNLARLAQGGDGKAHKLLLDSLDFAIRTAHHFNYIWPVQFDITDYSLIDARAPFDNRGQTDCNGLYAELMLHVHELTREPRYLEEAQRALDAAELVAFDLNYQANLTAWGAAACMRLWRITNQPRYRDLGYSWLASFFHNSVMWESELAHARHYRLFMGVTCLQDAPYLAIYECFDSFAAFEALLRDAGSDLDPAVRSLVSQYCRYTLDSSWFFYPDTLPAEALATEIRNGHIDPALSFPLEDLYADGQPAGQVGQEIYGAGAALVFASRAYHRIAGAPFMLYCDHFLMRCEMTRPGCLMLRIDGGEAQRARIAVIGNRRSRLRSLKLTRLPGGPVDQDGDDSRDIQFTVPASGDYCLTWD